MTTESCISLLLTKSIYLIKFNPTLENPEHIQNSFLSVPLPQTFCTFLQPDFVSYSFHLEIISFRTNQPFFLEQNIFPFLIPSFLKTHHFFKQPGVVFYISILQIGRGHLKVAPNFLQEVKRGTFRPVQPLMFPIFYLKWPLYSMNSYHVT